MKGREFDVFVVLGGDITGSYDESFISGYCLTEQKKLRAAYSNAGYYVQGVDDALGINGHFVSVSVRYSPHRHVPKTEVHIDEAGCERGGQRIECDGDIPSTSEGQVIPTRVWCEVDKNDAVWDVVNKWKENLLKG